VGRGLHNAAKQRGCTGIFESEDIGLIATGEKAGQVPDSLSRLAQIYREKADAARSIGKFWSISNMILFQIVVSGVVVIFIAKTYAGVLLKLMP